MTIQHTPPRKHRKLLTTSAILISLTALTACAGQAPADNAGADDAENVSQTEDVFAAFEGDNFDLDELIEKAQDEGPITIYDNASAVEDIADNFSEKYGIDATGTKVDASEALEMVTREAQSDNVVHQWVESFSSVRRTGSGALSIAHVAAGWTDASLGTGVNTWDVAAAMLILQRAGGTYRPLHYSADPTTTVDDHYAPGYLALAPGAAYPIMETAAADIEQGRRA